MCLLVVMLQPTQQHLLTVKKANLLLINFVLILRLFSLFDKLIIQHHKACGRRGNFFVQLQQKHVFSQIAQKKFERLPQQNRFCYKFCEFRCQQHAIKPKKFDFVACCRHQKSYFKDNQDKNFRLAPFSVKIVILPTISKKKLLRT